MEEQDKNKKDKQTISHSNQNCKDPLSCKPHGEFGDVEYNINI